MVRLWRLGMDRPSGTALFVTGPVGCADLSIQRADRCIWSLVRSRSLQEGRHIAVAGNASHHRSTRVLLFFNSWLNFVSADLTSGRDTRSF